LRAAVHWLAGSECEVNFGWTSLAAPKAASSSVSRYSRTVCRGVLLVRVRLDQAGIDGHALAADQAFLDAPRDGRLEQVAEQFAVTEPAVSVF